MLARLRRVLIAGAAVFATLSLSACGVNTIPTLEEQVTAAWGQVQNQYQRRTDLVPNLVETVRGFATQERQTLQAVVEARAKATQVTISADIVNDPDALRKFQEAQSQLTGALSRLLAVSEAYPDLKSNQNFLALQSQLEGTENRIAVARRDYIESVRRYNTEIRTFPGMIWVAVLHRDAKPKASFTAEEAAQQAPKVKF
jgi:LemA protein